MKPFRNSTLLLVAVITLAGCGDSAEPSRPADPGSNASTDARDATDGASENSESTAGRLALTVDGVAKTFTEFPADRNLSMSMSTMILARPSADATEEFSMAVMSFDLSKAELPATLQLGMRQAMESDDPSQFASAPKPLISYVSPDGVDYSSYATIVFDTYDNGIATGRVDDIELQPSDGDGPPVMLSDIRFEVAL
ncbi:hypothetical protein HFP89_06165 [Wenzhouxiangella sp. XN79A]|uniref:hypothetical protein n=1 Tax=Wenzhouxiangella sp. XN79A TaxID=2724193 RepID=UPI00144AE673|nr:hypothetical protein [Wenzhouxiangella sp. XN79A]NKI34746.1 hypothetical protein [Wenzhouxiangella sp. XN79A]